MQSRPGLLYASVLAVVLHVVVALARGSASRPNTSSSSAACLNTTTGVVFVALGLDFQCPPGSPVAATASFTNSSTSTGWYQLAVKTYSHVNNNGVNESTAMYAAGMVEAALTVRLMEAAFLNLADRLPSAVLGPAANPGSTAPSPVVPVTVKWLMANRAWMMQQAAASPGDPFWRHAGLVLDQQSGLFDGYNAFCTGNHCQLPLGTFLLAGPDTGDLLSVFAPSGSRRNRSALQVAESEHCSALIKPTFNDTDGAFTGMLAAHVTWGTYSQGLLRLFKRYEFNLEGAAATTLTFSGYPIFLSSADDFYVASPTGLAVTETTLDVYDEAALRERLTEKSVLTWVRSIVATRVAPTPGAWAPLFSRNQSGTCNCEWMVTNMKGGKPAELFVLEQAPGLTEVRDVTTLVNASADQYWASYNIPAFPSIRERLGYPDDPSSNHTQAPRARIFARDAPSVRDVSALQRLMRSNDYRSDPLSHGLPSNAISSRFDLMPTGSGNVAAFGGVDCKVLSPELYAVGVTPVVLGPTHQSLPVFDWNERNGTFVNVPHDLQAQNFPFNWTTMTWD